MLEKLGLHRPELRAWAMYDWANSAFVTTIAAVLLPIFYSDVIAADLPEHLRTAYWGYTSGIALLIVAVISPFLGVVSDILGSKKSFIAGFMVLGITGSVGLYFVGRGDWLLASGLFIMGNIGFAAGNVFYEAMLPEIARPDELDKVSTSGYAVGYIGGGLLLALNLAWVQFPTTFGFSDTVHAVQASFISVGVWWVVFSLPLFFRIKEHRKRSSNYKLGELFFHSFARLKQTFADIKSYRQVFLFLLAFWIYSDGIGTIIKMATIYGREIGISQGQLIGAMLLVQFLGIPFTFGFGFLAAKIGSRSALMLSLVIYALICVYGFFMETALDFWVLAAAVAVVQGGCQGLSRSIFTSLIPVGRSAEFFGFYSVSSKFAGVIGPLLFGLISQMLGNSRLSILCLVLFFVVGLFILSKVRFEST